MFIFTHVYVHTYKYIFEYINPRCHGWGPRRRWPWRPCSPRSQTPPHPTFLVSPTLRVFVSLTLHFASPSPSASFGSLTLHLFFSLALHLFLLRPATSAVRFGPPGLSSSAKLTDCKVAVNCKVDGTAKSACRHDNGRSTRVRQHDYSKPYTLNTKH